MDVYPGAPEAFRQDLEIGYYTNSVALHKLLGVEDVD